MEQRAFDSRSDLESRIALNVFPRRGEPATSPKTSPFTMVRRGYDPTEVDRQLEELRQHIDAERQRAGAASNRVAQAEAEAGDEHAISDRVERMLRMAGREAAEVRAAATEDAAVIRDDARNSAAANDREIAESMASWQIRTAQQAEQLRTHLQAHRDGMATETASTTAEAAAIHAAATRGADQLLAEAETHARGITSAARQAADEQHQQSRAEIGRLTSTRDGIGAELTRLQEYLDQALGSVGREATDAPAPRSQVAGTQQGTAASAAGPRAH